MEFIERVRCEIFKTLYFITHFNVYKGMYMCSSNNFQSCPFTILISNK